MNAEEINAGKLFVSGQQLLIPLWQRHYSWDKPQWDELWTDIIRVDDEGLAGHFLGSVVLHALPWSGLPSEAHRFWVVDGQQRITTLHLLVCAMRDRIAQLEPTEADREKTVREYTSQMLRNENLKEGHQARLVLQERDAALLGPIVQGTWAGDPNSLVERAYVYFRDRLSDLDQHEVVALMSLVQVKLSAVWVTLEEGDNAHRVFQTLNAGGKKLNQSDLVRNYFFLLLGDLGNDFYAKYWRSLENDLSDRELEEFLVAWSISQGYTGGKDSLFNYFHKDLLPHENVPSEVLDYGIELAETARLFRLIRRPGDSSYKEATKRVLVDLRNWGTLPAEGLILWLLRRHHDDRLTEQDLAGCLEVVLSFMARRQIAAFEPNLHKSIFVATARKLRTRNAASSEEIVDYLRYILTDGREVRTWPTDEAIKLTARSTPIYSRSRSGWAFTILERANRSFFKNEKHAPAPLDRSKYSVEHVMPQNLTAQWIEDLEAWGVSNPRLLHEGHLHVIGNLTLTAINSELSDLPFEEKRTKIEDDWLPLNAQIATSHTWTESGINERSSALALRVSEAFIAPMGEAEFEAAKSRFADESNDEDAEAVQLELENEGG